ncbi:MAG: condensation domain-containing protein, partial [Cyanobacteria bacterium P01_C01_bin.72]
FQIAPDCLSYCGTDFSTSCLNYIRQQIKLLGENNFSNVSLRQGLAHNLLNAEVGKFDTIILNSVVQYFPSINYLLEVLQGAIKILLASGGSIFVGDVRSLPLLETFHTSVNFYRADDSLSIDEFKKQVRNAVNQEEELVIDPAFFMALKQHLPQIDNVEIQLKQGDYHNELTLFRYDVIIHVAQESYSKVTPQWLNYGGDGVNLPEIKQLLAAQQPEILGIKGIPNARLLEEACVEQKLSNLVGNGTIGQLRETLHQEKPVGVEPQTLWNWQEELPYSVQITWSGTGDNSCYDALFIYNKSTFGQAKIIPDWGITASVKPWNSYANNPLKQELERHLVSQLPSFLGSKLPNYMLPETFVVLEALPLTPNGKVDRKALSQSQAIPASLSDIVPASTPIESWLADVWSEILGLETVGVNHNFFELGGHSLVATRVISQIQQVLNVELPLRSIFESPTIKELAKEVERANTGRGISSIKPVTRARDLPLSFAQQRLWFIAQLEPNSPAYNVSNALSLKGKLNIGVLTQTTEAIIQRHEVFRTNFATVAGQPVQVIHPQINFQLPIIDLTELSQPEQQQEVNQLNKTERLKPFNLEQDALLRVTLIKLNELEHIILFTMHHIISDAWSTGILVQEIVTLYQSFLEGKSSPLPELTIQYADYAVWQRESLQEEVLDQQLNYWKQKLGSGLPVLQLPYHQQKPIVKTNRSLSHSFELSRELTVALKQLSRQTNTTLFMVILATLKTLLYRYTQQEDIVIGTDIANRNRAEIEGLIGFFINILVLRTDLSGYPSFRELLARVKEVTLSAYAHQDLPFDRLVQELQPSRQLKQTPLFQVLLVMNNVPTGELSLPGLTITALEQVDNYAKFDLVLFITDSEAGIVGRWQFNRDLFDAKTIAKLSNQYIALLQNIVAKPDIRINNLSMITQEKEEQQAQATQKKSKLNKFLKARAKANSVS